MYAEYFERQQQMYDKHFERVQKICDESSRRVVISALMALLIAVVASLAAITFLHMSSWLTLLLIYAPIQVLGHAAIITLWYRFDGTPPESQQN